MNNHNDITQDEQDDVIDQNIREAHGQIQLRNEWAERVLLRIAKESTRQGALAKSSVSESLNSNVPTRLLGRKTLALAATILFAALGTYWLLSTSQRPDSSGTMGSEFAKRITEPSEELTELQEDSEPSIQGLQQIDTVTATPGYLAAKLTDDPEFEIYMVLPQTSVNQF